jgi:probable HAF family extracellular repeat protein
MRVQVLIVVSLAMSVSSMVHGQSVLSLTTTGAGSVTIPAGYEWTNVTVQCWGGGGGGAFTQPVTGVGAGGGGGGAFSSMTYATALLAGTYNYYVGPGGAGPTYGPPFLPVSGGSGGNTIWNYGGAQDIVAGGGGGGLANGGGNSGLVLAGTGYSGGGGGLGYSGGYGGGGGGSGGPSGAGGDGGPGSSAAISIAGSGGAGYGPGGDGGFDGDAGNGMFPGGGGGGGGNNNAGNGANGEIVITYTQQAVPEPSALALLGIGAFCTASFAFRKRRSGQVLALLVVAASTAVSSRAIGVEYHVTDLGTLSGGTSSVAAGINNNGQIVGDSATSSGDTHAFVYSGGTMTDLGVLTSGYHYSDGRGINDSGQTVGSSAISITGGISGQLRPIIVPSGGTMTSLGSLGGGYGFANGINNLGQVAGLSTLGDGSTTQAFLYSSGTMTDLGSFAGTSDYSDAYGINNHTQVVGVSTSNGIARGFIWQSGTMTDLGDLQGGAGATRAYAINSLSQVVGETTVAGSPVGHAFLWQSGNMTDLGVVPGTDSSYALGINDNGFVVGRSYNATSGVAFIWDGADGIRDLNALLDSSGTGWTLEGATGINGSGQICGYGINPSGRTDAFLLTPVPEPSTLALLGLGGICAICVFARRSVSARVDFFFSSCKRS